MTPLIAFECIVAPLLTAAIIAATVAAMKVLRPFRQFLSDWAGEPARPGVPRKLGVMERLGGFDRLAEKIDEIHYEVKPNGGGSLADQVNRTAEAVGASSPHPAAAWPAS